MIKRILVVVCVVAAFFAFASPAFADEPSDGSDDRIVIDIEDSTDVMVCDNYEGGDINFSECDTYERIDSEQEGDDVVNSMLTFLFFLVLFGLLGIVFILVTESYC